MKYILILGLCWLSCSIAIAKDEICPADTPMRKTWYFPQGGYNYECVSCDSRYLNIPKEECDKCVEKRVFENGYCFFKKSLHKAFPLFDIGYEITDGGGWVASVVGCGAIKPVFTSRSNCEECPNREYVDGKCVLKDRKQTIKKEDIHGNKVSQTQKTTQTQSKSTRRDESKWRLGGQILK